MHAFISLTIDYDRLPVLYFRRLILAALLCRLSKSQKSTVFHILCNACCLYYRSEFETYVISVFQISSYSLIRDKMVYFNCDACGESLKKNQVEKHRYKCRNCHVLSCVDCGHSFRFVLTSFLMSWRRMYGLCDHRRVGAMSSFGHSVRI